MQAFIACFSLLFDAEDVSHFCSLKERKKRFPKPAGEKPSMGLERTSLKMTVQNGTFWPERG